MPSPRPKLTCEFLSDGVATIRLDGREIPFTVRHAEILTLLALHPGGLSVEKLALLFYGESGNPVTVRAEIHRPRLQLGANVVQTRHYRLSAKVDADFLRAFRGPLLPESESPAVREERESLTALVRRVVLESRDPGALWAFWETSCGADDLAVVDELCLALPADDPRRAIALNHRARL
ncbi:helix-turn-helix domain-containing protein [Amycolatopsis sp. H20-H5]|uniref:helix-turn-helix domain-containing protein n=1 Tax=Amycolatopsis sp. H20-H5 TaxID=3046309 RepID=UPI002DB65B0F|nr:helix-turn-helix domain-containing protein [Amycolatopsis sp. H20-H5]MEC3982322.1 helix-turn-helix domain-containing protein [Amycolatopsis sp. H20-H5]